MTTPDHVQLVRQHGLEVVAVAVHVAAELQRVSARRAGRRGGVFSSFREFAEIGRRTPRLLTQSAFSGPTGLAPTPVEA